MVNLTGDISNLVFVKILRGDLGEISLDGQTLSVLMQIDGKRALKDVSQATGLSLIEIRSAITKLLDLNIIAAGGSADNDFIETLEDELAHAVGPIARVLIEDGADEMGISLDGFPLNRAAEMVEILARDIPREEKRLEFQTTMLEYIRNL